MPIRKPRNNADECHCAETRRDGAFRAICFVAPLARGACHGRRVASRISSRKASVAATRGLFRGSLMRLSRFFLSTLKEAPAEAELASHRLMLRAGMIKRLAAGIYTWMPLGLRVLRKVEAVVREEMNRAGAIELLMPVIQPAELWQESGRWDKYGPDLLRIKDRHQRDFVVQPTSEEVITDIARRERAHLHAAGPQVPSRARRYWPDRRLGVARVPGSGGFG